MTEFAAGDLEGIADLLKALAHDVRLKLLHALKESGEKSVGELEGLTAISQPGLSQQLAILRKAGLVQTRRDAKLVIYSLAPGALSGVTALLCQLSGISRESEARASETPAFRQQSSAATFARLL